MVEELKSPGLRPPRPIFIGVTGGTASGKTTICRYLLNTHFFLYKHTFSLTFLLLYLGKENSIARLFHSTISIADSGNQFVLTISVKKNTKKQTTTTLIIQTHSILNWLMKRFGTYWMVRTQVSRYMTLRLIKGSYLNLKRNRTPGKFKTIESKKVIIFEGILALYDRKIRDLMDLKIFVQTDSDTCLGRRGK